MNKKERGPWAARPPLSVVAAALFAVMALGVRSLSDRIPGPQIACVRFTTGLLVVALLGFAGQVDLRPRRWGWLTSRGIAGGLAVVSYFACIEHVGVGVATLAQPHRSGLVVAVRMVAAGRGPATARPVCSGADHGRGDAGGGAAGERASHSRIGWWELVGIFSAVTTGIAVTSIRAVRRPRLDGTAIEGSWTVFFSFTALGLLSTLPWVVGRWVTPTLLEWGILLGAAATSIVAQLAMTKALASVTAVTSGVILQLTVVLSMLGGIALFDESLSARAAVGALLTMLGVMWMVVSAGRIRSVA